MRSNHQGGRKNKKAWIWGIVAVLLLSIICSIVGFIMVTVVLKEASESLADIELTTIAPSTAG